MKKIAILTAYQREYIKYDLYFPSEKLMKWMFKDEQLEIHYVSPHYYDTVNKCFTQHVCIHDHDLEVIQEPYTPDLLRVRMGQALYHVDEMFADADFITVPNMRLKHIDSDKYQMYQYLKEFQPKSTLLTTFYFYPRLQKEFSNDLVVKPLSGSGGYGIEFYTQDELRSNEVFSKYSGTEGLHMIQEYKNFSKGMPNGLAEGNHDLRVVFFGKKPGFSIVRVPATGNLKSNIASGGHQYSLPLEKIPQEVIVICDKAQVALGIQANDMYSLDFAYCADEKRRYIIEMNSSPGIWFPDEDKAYQEQFFLDTAQYFHDLLIYEDLKKSLPTQTGALPSGASAQLLTSDQEVSIEVYL